MKKLFTLALAAAATLGAAASTNAPVMAASPRSQSQQFVERQQKSFDMAPQMQVVANARQHMQLSDARQLAPRASVKETIETGLNAADSLQVLYTLPAATYYQFIKINLTSGGWTWPAADQQALWPPFSEVKCENWTNNWKAFLSGPFDWKDYKGNSVSTETDYVIENTGNTYAPGYITPYQVSPTLDYVRNDSLFSFMNGAEYNGNYYVYYFEAGGDAAVSQEDIDGWNAVSGVASTEDGGLLVGPTCTPEFYGLSHWGDWIEQGPAFTNIYSSKLSSLTDPYLYGAGQIFPANGRKMAISRIVMNAWVGCAAGATLTATLLDASTGAAFAQTTYTFEEAQDTTRYDIPFEFTSTVGIDEVPYVVSTGNDVLLMVSGFANNSEVTYFSPILEFYTFAEQGVDMVDYSSYLYFAGSDGNILIVRNTLGNSQVAGKALFARAYLEFPYLQVSDAYNGTDWIEEFPSNETYEVVLDKADAFELFDLDCPAPYDEVTFEFADGKDHDWLALEYYSAGEIAEANEGEDVGQNGFRVVIGLAEGVEVAQENVELIASYKGYTQTFQIRAAAGIEDIEADGHKAARSEYFDLQGRRLNEAPAQGLYLRRDIAADGSANVQKVVK